MSSAHLNKILLNNQYSKEEITREVGKYLEMSENENTQFMNSYKGCAQRKINNCKCLH